MVLLAFSLTGFVMILCLYVLKRSFIFFPVYSLVDLKALISFCSSFYQFMDIHCLCKVVHYIVESGVGPADRFACVVNMLLRVIQICCFFLVFNIMSVSVMDNQVIEDNPTSETEDFKDPERWRQFKVPGIRPSMSMSDLVNHLGHCISEQINSGNPQLAGDSLTTKDILEEITQYLLSDSQNSSASDEKSLMSRVNSLCCLIQKDAGAAQSLQINSGDGAVGDDVMFNASKPGSTSERKPLFDFAVAEGESNDAPGCKQPANISRKESFGELLMHLPRIASLPQFLFNISEDAENQAR